MKILKKVLLGVGIVVGLLLITALFVSKDYSVEREIAINKSRGDVFNYVKYIKNQDHYSKWVMTDPKMKKDFKGKDGEVGFIYAWDSEDKAVGKGEQEIRNITEGEALDLEIRFKKPFEGIANTRMSTESISAEQTKVKWSMKGRSPYPFNLMNIFMDQMLGEDLATSLNNLKSVVESSQTSSAALK